ncbi:MAG: hypothetical protein K1Y02_04535 [Candidatus Hydrogenedentes bacterium]|nr:hypothetical protein [Candidatus Hydrogenedentota bacterium]
MKNLGIEKWLAIVAIIVGGCWIAYVFLSLRGPAMNDHSLIGLLFLVVSSSFIWIPAAFSTYFGIALLRDTTKENIRVTVGALVAWTLITLVFAVPVPNVDEEDIDLIHSVLLLAGTIAAIPVHMVVCHAVVRRAGMVTRGRREFFSKIALAIAIIQILHVGPNLAERFAAENPRFRHDVTRPWVAGGYLGSLILAWAFYRVTVWLVKRGQPVAQSVVHAREPQQSS